MKPAITGLAAGLVFFTLLLFASGVTFTSNTVDVHWSDTYFIMDYVSFCLLLLLLAATLFSFGGAISTRFKNKWFLMAAVVSLAVNGLVITYFVNLF